MGLTFFEALIVGLYYWFAWWDLCYPLFTGVAWWQDCVWCGTIMGIIFGDPMKGLMIGGALGMIYLGALPVGANLPSDYCLATVIAVPLAIKNNWSVETAAAMSAAFGVLGTFLDHFRRGLNTMFNTSARKHIENKEYGKLTWDAIFSPILLAFFIRCVPLTALLYVGGAGVAQLVAQFPVWVSHGMEVIGGMLPALGLTLCMNAIGKSKLLPFFILGFYMQNLLGVNALTSAVIAFSGAMVFIMLKQKDDQEIELNFKDFRGEITDEGKITKKDHAKLYYKWIKFHRCSQAIDTFYGTGMAYCYRDILAKVYEGNDEMYQQAMLTTLTPFIPEIIWGSAIIGIDLAMEEQIAAGAEGVDHESIVAIKSSLMGPVAGLGDSINYMVFWTLLKSTFYPMAAAGSYAGLLCAPILHIVLPLWGWECYKAGYKMGAGAIVSFLRSGVLDVILEGAGVMGYMMLGVMASSNVKITTPLVIMTKAGTAKPVQVWLNIILPGALPLIFTLLCFRYLRKGGKSLRLLAYIAIGGLLLSLIGVL